jgi:mRNA-degrading endonuclease YafQ of YafQ-DinJ toxin-antitoxin module
MRRIERSTAFKKDFKRVQKGQGGAKVQALLTAVLEKLIVDEPLPVKTTGTVTSGPTWC